jgi:hypothetical protein
VIPAEDIENRFKFHPADTPERISAHELVRNTMWNAAEYVNENVPDGREKSLAITALEDAMMWANAGIARAK